MDLYLYFEDEECREIMANLGKHLPYFTDHMRDIYYYILESLDLPLKGRVFITDLESGTTTDEETGEVVDENSPEYIAEVGKAGMDARERHIRAATMKKEIALACGD